MTSKSKSNSVLCEALTSKCDRKRVTAYIGRNRGARFHLCAGCVDTLRKTGMVLTPVSDLTVGGIFSYKRPDKRAHSPKNVLPGSVGRTSRAATSNAAAVAACVAETEPASLATADEESADDQENYQEKDASKDHEAATSSDAEASEARGG